MEERLYDEFGYELDSLEEDEQEIRKMTPYNMMISDDELNKIDSSIDEYHNDWYDI